MAESSRLDPYKRPFPRFASASTVAKLFDKVRHPQKSFRRHQGRDGRQGFVSSTNLGWDWVLAESKQVAMDATPQHVLEAYLSGKLQTKWNSDSVLSWDTDEEREIFYFSDFLPKRLKKLLFKTFANKKWVWMDFCVYVDCFLFLLFVCANENSNC